jgi:hypothetical protein
MITAGRCRGQVVVLATERDLADAEHQLIVTTFRWSQTISYVFVPTKY